MTRVAVFIDYQNTYKGARECFGFDGGRDFTKGQIYPRRLGVLLSDKGRQGPRGNPTRELEYVKAFRGEPSAKHSEVGQAATQRQVRFWNAQKRVEAITRPLKYSPTGKADWNGDQIFKAEEKGIDVLVALHMVVGAMKDEYDVAVLVSADTDLAPAVETVFELGKHCEVAGWNGKRWQRSRISIDGGVWCHWLDERDYAFCEDPTDYTRPQPGEPPASP